MWHVNLSQQEEREGEEQEEREGERREGGNCGGRVDRTECVK